MAAAVLITGANRGLGFEFARQYSAEGWRIFAACRNPATADELGRLAQDRRGRLNVVATDVADDESVKNALMVSEGLISKIEALLVRGFANDLLNTRMESILPRKKSAKKT